MKRWAGFIGILSFVAAGCGQGGPLPATSPPPEVEGMATAAEADTIRMNDINLYLHDTRTTTSAAHKPTFWLHADTFSVLDEQVWAIEDARAVVYNRQTNAEEMVLEGKRGRFEQNVGAYLKDGVKAYLGDTVIYLEDMEWVHPQDETTKGVAFTDHPLKVENPKIKLQADSLRLYPDTKEFEMTDVSGVVYFGK